MSNFDMGRVPPVTFGAGRRSALPDVLRSLTDGTDRALLVADKILADLGVAGEIEAALTEAGFTVDLAAEIAGEPKEALVDHLADRARDGCAGVVALGGGAAMDAAKLVAAIAGADAPCATYALGAEALPRRGLPTVAIPTTAGTGSEVTRTSIVSTAEGVKNWYWSEALMFDHALLDPELTLTLPPHVTAWTGIDAVAHALEAATSRKSNSAGRLYGFAALADLSAALPRAVADGQDLDARGKVLWASMVAGLALHNCNTHMGHNISHALGSLAPVHHGLATGLALEVTLPWLVQQAAGRCDYADAAAALGGPRDANALPERFSTLMRTCGIDCALPDTCAEVTAETLAEHMKLPANRGMADNAACKVSDTDLDRFAEDMVSLQKIEVAA